MTSGPVPICYGCERLWPISATPQPARGPITLRCDAFTDGIPEAITDSVVDHRDPVAGDGGQTFKPFDLEQAQYAAILFDKGKGNE